MTSKEDNHNKSEPELDDILKCDTVEKYKYELSTQKESCQRLEEAMRALRIADLAKEDEISSLKYSISSLQRDVEQRDERQRDSFRCEAIELRARIGYSDKLENCLKNLQVSLVERRDMISCLERANVELRKQCETLKLEKESMSHSMDWKQVNYEDTIKILKGFLEDRDCESVRSLSGQLELLKKSFDKQTGKIAEQEVQLRSKEDELQRNVDMVQAKEKLVQYLQAQLEKGTSEYSRKMSELQANILSLQIELSQCESARERLSLRNASLTEEVDSLKVQLANVSIKVRNSADQLRRMNEIETEFQNVVKKNEQLKRINTKFLECHISGHFM